jgi:LuxR family maltose regulon positive regulatory protein
LAQASHWAAADSPPPIDQYTYIAAYAQLLCGWLDLLQGQAARTIQRLAPLIETARIAGHTQQLIQLLAIQALAHAATGDTALAHRELHQLLQLTAPEGYIRIYVDMGEPMCDLLERLRLSNTDLILAAYKQQLLAAFAPPSAQQHRIETILPIETPARTSVNLVEPLSEREREILRLVADGLSNSQLADKLIVTVGTVKKHLNNIYGKLGVASRTQAIVRGRELGLLAD